jgi:hypothetical protein
MTMREWLMADICLMYVMVGLMVSAAFWSVKNKKVAIKFIIVGVIITIFVLGTILYFYIFQDL